MSSVRLPLKEVTRMPTVELAVALIVRLPPELIKSQSLPAMPLPLSERVCQL